MATVLSSTTRKRALAALTDAEDHLTVAELARIITDRDDSASGASGGDDRRARTALYHCDLPKLAAYDLVEWDPEARRAAATSEGAACAAALGL